jgi:hypothetical protein
VGIQPNVLMWAPGTGPKRPDKALNNTGRRDKPDLISAKEVVRALPKHAWHTIKWREGSGDWLSLRVCACASGTMVQFPGGSQRSGCAERERSCGRVPTSPSESAHAAICWPAASPRCAGTNAQHAC